jgi:thioredoxin reductase (NADPH)
MKTVDLVIIGAGPAGMMASIYAVRARKQVLLIEKNSPGGRVKSTYEVENYLGFGRVNAEDLVRNMVSHMRDLGIEDVFGACVDVRKVEGGFLVNTDRDTYRAKAVIIASGTRPKPLGVEGEKRLLGQGVSYCAVCDGIFFENKNVVVIGGGDSALEEALYLANVCSSVTVLHDLAELTATRTLVERVKHHAKITVRQGCKVLRFLGDKKLDAVEVFCQLTQNNVSIPADGAFIYVGNHPETQFLSQLPVLDPDGFVIVKPEMTSAVAGLFAAGDVTKKDYRLIATAISDGAIAALSAVKYLDDHAKKE